MNFGQALAALKGGFQMQRAGWNGKGMHIELQTPDENSKMGHPYVYMKGVDGKLCPWAPSQVDLLAEDWQGAEGFTEAQHAKLHIAGSHLDRKAA